MKKMKRLLCLLITVLIMTAMLSAVPLSVNALLVRTGGRVCGNKADRGRQEI